MTTRNGHAAKKGSEEILLREQRLMDRIMPIRAPISPTHQRMVVEKMYGSYRETDPELAFKAQRVWESCACTTSKNGAGGIRCNGAHRRAQAMLVNLDTDQFDDWCNRTVIAVASGKLQSLTPQTVCELLRGSKCSWVKAQAIVACLEREGVEVTVPRARPLPQPVTTCTDSADVAPPPPPVQIAPEICPNNDGSCVVPECAEAATQRLPYLYRTLLCKQHNAACVSYVHRHWKLVRRLTLGRTWVWLFVNYPQGPSPSSCPFIRTPATVRKRQPPRSDGCRVPNCYNKPDKLGLCHTHCYKHWAWRRERGLRGRQPNHTELVQQWLTALQALSPR